MASSAPPGASLGQGKIRLYGGEGVKVSFISQGERPGTELEVRRGVLEALESGQDPEEAVSWVLSQEPEALWWEWGEWSS